MQAVGHALDRIEAAPALAHLARPSGRRRAPTGRCPAARRSWRPRRPRWWPTSAPRPARRSGSARHARRGSPARLRAGIGSSITRAAQFLATAWSPRRDRSDRAPRPCARTGSRASSASRNSSNAAGRHHEPRRHGDAGLGQLAERAALAAHRRPVGDADVLEPGDRRHRCGSSSDRLVLEDRHRCPRPPSTRMRWPSLILRRRRAGADHRGQAVFARDDGHVAHRSADVGDRRADLLEDRRPGRVGHLADEDVALLDAADLGDRLDHPRGAFDHARAGGEALELVGIAFASLR